MRETKEGDWRTEQKESRQLPRVRKERSEGTGREREKRVREEEMQV